MIGRLSAWLAICCCLPAAGCGLLPLPYMTDVSGPVHGIRVLDAVTGDDIPNAHAALDTDMGMANWVGARPPQLLIISPDSPESKSLEGSSGLTRRPDRVFAVSKRFVMGFVCRRYAECNPATAVVTVFAPGYPQIMLQYCEGNAPQAGWSDARSLAPRCGSPPEGAPEAAAEQEMELVRCDLGADGVLRFYLRQLSPELAEAIRSPGRLDLRCDPSPVARDRTEFVSAEEPLVKRLPPQAPASAATR